MSRNCLKLSNSASVHSLTTATEVARSRLEVVLRVRQRGLSSVLRANPVTLVAFRAKEKREKRKEEKNVPMYTRLDRNGVVRTQANGKQLRPHRACLRVPCWLTLISPDVR